MKTYPGKLRPIVFTGILIAGLLWIWFSRIESDARSITPAPQAGYPAPGLALETLDAKQVSLAELKGTAVILNYWASWCPPCRAEMSDFQQASLEYDSSDLMIIGVNATNQDSIADVEAFIDQYAITFPILLDRQGVAAKDFQVHSLPSTFFIDADGVIQKVVIGGPIPLSQLRIEAENLIEVK